MATYAMTKEGLRLGESPRSYYIVYYWIKSACYRYPNLTCGRYLYGCSSDVGGFSGEASMLILYISLLSYAGVLAYGVLIKPSVISKIIKWFAKVPLL